MSYNSSWGTRIPIAKSKIEAFVWSSHVDIQQHNGQALELGLSAFPFSYFSRGDSPESANARHL